MLVRDMTKQTVGEEVVVAPGRSLARKGEGEKKVLPLVVVPFEPTLGEDLVAQKKQTDKVRRVRALTKAQAMLCAVPRRLRRVEEEAAGASAAKITRAEEDGDEGVRPYVPNWLRVTAESNLATSNEKLE